MAVRYLSVCSGIEAASVAWKPLGWECAAMSEIEKFPRAVLQQHYPDTPLHGDFTTIKGDEYGPINLLVGGTPCQSFSVAGLRGGMADDRGNLALEFCRLALRARPRWVLWENVPGVLSSNEGKDFGSFLGALAECGYGFAYRVLDAQFVRVQSHEFAVPQRRRRVFAVGYLGDWRPAAKVLFERESLSRNPSPRRESGQRPTGTISSRTTGGGGTDFELAGGLVAEPVQPFEVANCMTRRMHKGVNSTVDEGQTPVIAFSSKDHGGDAGETSPTLRAMNHNGSHANGGGQVAVAFAQNTRDEVRMIGGDGSVAGALSAEPGMKQQTYLNQFSGVRRLMPIECERLQGFPDDYTNVTYRNKPAFDGPRYKAIGNSMAVNVMSWIGQRIQQVESTAG